MLHGKKILLGVTGSIAAYKSLLVVRLLIKEGAHVKVIQTPASRDFVTPLSLATLSKNPVRSDLFMADTWANHVELGRWADVFVIAPLSCNTLAKMASGLCDNLLMATYLSAICPVLLAPAMDEDMWRHPATRANLQKVQDFGNKVVPVEKGELASGLFGDGRMAEPETILEHLRTVLSANAGRVPASAGSVPANAGGVSANAVSVPANAGGTSARGSTSPLIGKKALVTAGPTYEAIDPVRYIGNHSSGKMGIAIAKELAARGASVRLVLGPSSQDPDLPGVLIERVVSAAEMFEACMAAFAVTDIAILSAAVADYSPATTAMEKIKKTGDYLNLELVRTKDILKTLGGQKKQGQLLVGFALETSGGRDYALGKLTSKNADLIVLNSLSDEGAGFGVDTNKITIFGKDGFEKVYEKKPKQQVAQDIVDTVINRYYA